MSFILILTSSIKNNKISNNDCFQATEAKEEVKDEKANVKTKEEKQEEEEEEEEAIPQLVPIATPVKKPKLKVSSLLLCFLTNQNISTGILRLTSSCLSLLTFF